MHVERYCATAWILWTVWILYF